MIASVTKPRATARGLRSLFALAWLMPVAAHAALGGPASSIDADRVHLSARMAVSQAATHRVHMLTPASGSAVREYSTLDGTVFALSWGGPARPDLRQLLGGYFDAFAADARPRAGRKTTRLIAVSRPTLVVRSAGHPGAFFGYAFDPRLVPAGFTAADLR